MCSKLKNERKRVVLRTNQTRVSAASKALAGSRLAATRCDQEKVTTVLLAESYGMFSLSHGDIGNSVYELKENAP